MMNDPAVFNEHIRQAAEAGDVFFIGGYAVQQQRTPLTMTGSDGFPVLSTGVTFVLIGGTSHDRGACVFHIDTDDIDGLCEALQAAKNGPYAPENESTVHIALKKPQQQPEGD